MYRYRLFLTQIERLGEAVSRYRLFLYTEERLCPGTGCSCTKIKRLGETLSRYRLFLFTDREVVQVQAVPVYR